MLPLHQVMVFSSKTIQCDRKYRRQPGRGRKNVLCKGTITVCRFSLCEIVHIYISATKKLYILNTRQVDVSSKSVRKRLKEVGLNPKRPVKIRRLQPHHKKNGLEFARAHMLIGVNIGGTKFSLSMKQEYNCESQMVEKEKLENNTLNVILFRTLVLEEAPLSYGKALVWKVVWSI